MKSHELQLPLLPAGKPASTDRLAVHFSRDSDEWATPQNLFDELDNEFHFTLDPCSTADNKKCPRHFTRLENGLAQSWASERAFVNPPYSQLRAWIAKAAASTHDGALVVMLIPSRTDTKAFHRYIWDKSRHQPRPGVEIRFVEGRLKFGQSINSAPFPSAIAIFRPADVRFRSVSTSKPPPDRYHQARATCTLGAERP